MARREDLYEEAVRSHGSALDRLVRAYEADPEARRDLLQDVHLALWRSLESFDERCSLRTWTFRVAHNVSTSHVARDRRAKSHSLVNIDTVDAAGASTDGGTIADSLLARERLMSLIHKLKPLDRQVMILFLEGFDAESISDVTGISSDN